MPNPIPVVLVMAYVLFHIGTRNLPRRTTARAVLMLLLAGSLGWYALER